MPQCEALLDGAAVGWAFWQQEQGRWKVQVRCRYEPEYFYRATLEVGENQIPLGLLVPRENIFVTEKWLTPAQGRLLEQGEPSCRILKSRMDGRQPEEKAPPVKMLEPPGIPVSDLQPVAAESIRDELLAELVARRGDVLAWEHGLAMPARTDADPMAPFFCLMTPATCGGEYWYLLGLENGAPVPAEIRQKSSG